MNTMFREFFVLAFDPNRDDLRAVADYEIGSFDPTVFWSGERFEATIPAHVRVLVNEGDEPDYMGNPLSWDIVSTRFLRVIEQFVPRNEFQSFPAPLFDAITQTPIVGFHVVNLLRCCDAVVEPLESVGRMKLRSEAIPFGVNMFRIVAHETVELVSGQFASEIRKQELQGIALIKTAIA